MIGNSVFTESEFVQLFTDAPCQSLDCYYSIRDRIAVKVSVDLVTAKGTIAPPSIADLRALLRASYWTAMAHNLPVRDVVETTMRWPETVEAFARTRKTSDLSQPNLYNPDLGGSKPVVGWKLASELDYWSLNCRTEDEFCETVVALLAACSQEEARIFLDTAASVQSNPSLTALGTGELLDRRQHFLASYVEQQPTSIVSTRTAAAFETAAQRPDATEMLLELIQLMGLSEQKARELIDDIVQTHSVSIQPGDLRKHLILMVYQRVMLQGDSYMEDTGLVVSDAKHNRMEDATVLIASRTADLVERLLSKRDERARLIIQMKYIDGKNIEAIVEEICVSASTVLRVLTSFELEYELIRRHLPEPESNPLQLRLFESMASR